MHNAPAATLVYQPQALKGRGTAWAIEHRFTTDAHESFDDGWGTLEQAAREEQLAPATQIIEQQVKTILAGNESPDIAFDLSINPYRGCEHGCIYCFARPTHSYLNMSRHSRVPPTARCRSTSARRPTPTSRRSDACASRVR
jgi:hypothetical protein